MPYNSSNPYYIHRFTLSEAPPIQVDIYQAASTVRGQIGSDESVNNLLNLLQEYVNASLIQSARIGFESRHSTALLWRKLTLASDFMKSSTDAFPDVANEMFCNNELIRKDAHFFLISVDKIEKLWPRLTAQIFKPDPSKHDIDEIRGLRRRSSVALRNLLSTIGFDGACDYLEHVDEKIVSGEFNGFVSSSGGDGRYFEIPYSGEKVLLAGEPVANAYEKLIDLIRQIPVSRI